MPKNTPFRVQPFLTMAYINIIYYYTYIYIRYNVLRGKGVSIGRASDIIVDQIDLIKKKNNNKFTIGWRRAKVSYPAVQYIYSYILYRHKNICHHYYNVCAHVALARDLCGTRSVVIRI